MLYLVAWLLGSMPLFSTAQEDDAPPPKAFAMFRSKIKAILPNVDLPSHVVAPEGSLILYADFAAQDHAGVPLYLVNKTLSAIHLFTMEGSVSIQQERQTPEGQWERTQITQWGGCLGLGELVLPPGQFLQSRGYNHVGGQKARVRYAFPRHISLVSNEGEASVSLEAIEAARFHSQTLGEVPYHLHTTLTGPLTKPSNSSGPIPNSERVAALRLLQAYGNHPLLRREATRIATRLAESPTASADDKHASQTMLEILRAPWPQEPSQVRLRDFCLASLREDPSNAVSSAYGAPETHRPLLINILLELAAPEFETGAWLSRAERFSSSYIPAVQAWKPLYTMMDSILRTGAQEERYAIRDLLKIPVLVDEYISSESLVQWELDPQLQDLQEICTLTLSRRSQWERLAILVRDLLPDRKVKVLTTLASNSKSIKASQQTFRPPHSLDESMFWQSCMEQHPFETIEALPKSVAASESMVKVSIYYKLQQILKRESQRSANSPDDFELQNADALRDAVEILGGYKSKSDHELLRALLHHRGYKASSMKHGSNVFTNHYFPLRAAASYVLELQDVPISEAVITEKEIPEAEPAATRK